MITFVSASSPLLARDRLFLSALLLLVNCVIVTAQIRSVTDGYTPLGLAAGAPAGSYELSGFENVNPYNGGLNFSLPIKQVSGRGGAAYTIRVPIENKWRAEVDDFCDPQSGQCWHFESPIFGSWEYFNPYGPGELVGRRAGFGAQTQNIGCHYYENTYLKTITRLTFTVPGGTEFELRDQLLSGQPATVAYCATGPPSRGTVFVTADGTSATFVSDTTIYDEPMPGWEPIIFPSGYLMLRDGTRYRIDDGRVSWIRDRNGNKLTFTHTSNGFTVTDALNRQITVERVTDIAPYGLCDRITFKGFGGASRVVRVSWTNLGNVLRSGYVLQTPHALWPELNNASPWGTHDPDVISRIWLPDGRSYKFQYNSYGELARAELPTGGAIEYDWAPGVNGSSGGGAYCTMNYSVFAYRRVIERRIYPNGGSGGAYDSKMTFSRPESTTGYCMFSNVGYVNVKEFNSSGTLLTSARHYYFGSPTVSFVNSAFNPTSYPSWKEGKEWQTEMLATNDTTVLRRVGTTWQQRAAVSWWTGSANDAPPNDPRIADTTTTLVDTNQVSAQSYTYDDTVPFNNRSDVYEYHFGSGAPGALIRRTHTDYLKTNPVNGTDYTTTSIHIRSLPVQTQVFDASGVEEARTTFEYDNYANDGNHAPLQARSNISGLDSGFTTSYVTRGNLTRSTNWILSTSTELHSYAQYDVAGNMLKVIDPRGYATTLEFADRFGSPDSEAQGNSAPSELSTLTSYAFPTKITNALGHIAYSQFDYYLGRPVNAQDANGIVASGSYNDALDRPKQVKRAIGTTAENQTTFAYDDTARLITTSSDKDALNDNLLVSKILYDQMGRTKEQRQYEGGDNYVVTETQYDALGRPHMISNPYRRWQSETAVWTTQVFDALGRVLSVTTPDNAMVSTSYSGNTVTVTDQAGKKRQSVTDALGRLIEIYEDPTGVNYQTTYLYDVLDNLVKVTQGTQQRFFMYDSLRRLIRARNPEQDTRPSLSLSDSITGNSAWSIGYQYDENSNLTQKTDARGVMSTYEYDALNRNTTTNYSDTSVTPDVKRFYDGPNYGKGRFWYFYSGGDYSTGAEVDHTSIDSYDALGRPLVQRQLFKAGGIWSATYETSRAYNRAGGVTTQTYPSGNTVTYNYDAAGRLADKDAMNPAFSGNLGGVQRTYAKGITYSPWGSVNREQFGTNTAVYKKHHYNIRGQLCDVRASNSSDEWGGELGVFVNYYSTSWAHCGSGTDNNGNVLMSQTIINSYYMEDRYSYDALNRLTAVNEWQNGSTHTGSQQYTYDRWGNRTINAATWGTGINNTSFEKQDTTNRLYSPGDLALPDNSRRIRYDEAGNQIKDTYTGYGSANFDADNRISSIQNNSAGWSYYTYNADGKRTRRNTSSQETWQVYGFEGELLAEYAASAAAASPQKEYGYRNGQLLVTASSSQRQWLIADHLGTPRMIIDQTGTLANVKRHDYLPFGEELSAGVGGRTAGNGYSGGDGVRQQFTAYERDNETGLDYAQARYFSSTAGRFTTTDPLLASAEASAPQTWNRYSYGLNNPLRYNDPSGLNADDIGTAEDQRREQQPPPPPAPQPQPTPVATQSATLSNVPVCGGPIPTTVVVDQLNNPDARERNVEGTVSLVVGVDLRFTFLDQQGRPVSNAVVGETVENLEGRRVTQTTDPTPLNANGEAGDLVSNNSGPRPTSRAQLDSAISTFNQDFTTRQRITLTIVTETGTTVRVTQERTLTNMDRRAPSIQGYVRGYTFTMGKPTIEFIR